MSEKQGMTFSDVVADVQKAVAGNEPTSGAETNFGLQDLLALPEDETPLRETKTFKARGRDWKITIHADGKVNPDRFFLLQAIMGEAQVNFPGMEKPKIVFTDPKGKKIVVTNPTYIGNLKILANVAIAPGLRKPEEWAILGAKLGSDVMDEIISWALSVNGVTDYLLKAMDQLKNAFSVEEESPSGTTSDALVSIIN